MKLWLLRPRDDLPRDNDPWLWSEGGIVCGFVIRAETEAQARALAISENISPDDGRFHNPDLTTCVELSSDGEPGIIIEDFDENWHPS